MTNDGAKSSEISIVLYLIFINNPFLQAKISKNRTKCKINRRFFKYNFIIGAIFITFAQKR